MRFTANNAAGERTRQIPAVVERNDLVASILDSAEDGESMGMIHPFNMAPTPQ